MSVQNHDRSRAEQARKERNRRIALIVGIVVVLGAVVAAGAWYTTGSSESPKASTGAATAAGSGSVVLGNAGAPTKVVVYEDFQSPDCRELENATRDFLGENATAGKVRVEYHPVDLLNSVYGARAMNAFAAVLRHSTPAAALALHDLLYANQPVESDSSSVSPTQLLGLVKKAGGDNADVAAALESQDTAFFRAAAQQIATRKITSTPTVLVNGRPVPGDVSEIVDAIEKAVG